MKRLIIAGSPRSNGRSAHLAEMLFEACIDECPEDELYLAPVSELDIAGCIACDACKRAGELAAQARLVEAGIAESPVEGDADAGADADADADAELPIPYCPRFDDDMLELYDALVDADELVVVSPVFFSGAPAGLTALLDRLQPYFWEWLALRAVSDEGAALAAQKRPATLHVIGEGLDKNGYIALVSKVRSALAPAGFALERVMDWVGKIESDGTIIEEADEYRLPPLGMPLATAGTYLLPVDGDDADQGLCANEPAAAPECSEPHRAARPKLDLGGGNRGNRGDRSSGSSENRKGSSAKGGGAKGGRQPGANASVGGSRGKKGGGAKDGNRTQSGGARNRADSNRKGGKRHG